MSVLVIGATGFIGPRLIRKLLARGETVVGMDLNPAAPAFGDVPIGAPVVRGDVTQFEDVMRTVLDVKPERLINLASGWTTASRPPVWAASSAWCTPARSR
jgi:nucleoside-diphosphate-sugar epimerase